ncbi:peptidoglycan DD-metalloendopeptidase family protein [Clostridium paraputrificum]|uniref:peptidoglycan DD-metalloendopeptidase family protein n=1 Tax=Clostridium TaxID=1485 RepID=UPI003D339BD2
MISRKKRIVLISLLSICISLISVEYIFGEEESIYEIYFKERVVGYYDNKSEAKEVCSNEVSNINNRLSEVNLTANDFKYKKVGNEVAVSKKDEIRNNILGTLNGEATLIKMSIKDKDYGVIATEDEGKKVLRKLGELYIEKSNIEEENILAIDIKSNIKYEKVKTSIKLLDSIENIADKIWKENSDKSIVDVNIKCKENRVEEIAPNTKIISESDMYIGESKTEEGEVGSKEVLAEVTYKNGLKIGENVLHENVIENSKDNIIYKGSKNPIEDGFAFLEHPTRGGYITSNFGKRWGRNHNGLDIAHKIGDPVYSALDGIVKECHYESGYGNKILIEHEGNIETIYAHLSKFNIRIGDEVKKGELIGEVGNTGRSTGPHLHFEVRVNGAPVDPTGYITN